MMYQMMYRFHDMRGTDPDDYTIIKVNKGGF